MKPVEYSAEARYIREPETIEEKWGEVMRLAAVVIEFDSAPLVRAYTIAEDDNECLVSKWKTAEPHARDFVLGRKIDGAYGERYDLLVYDKAKCDTAAHYSFGGSFEETCLWSDGQRFDLDEVAVLRGCSKELVMNELYGYMQTSTRQYVLAGRERGDGTKVSAADDLLEFEKIVLGEAVYRCKDDMQRAYYENPHRRERIARGMAERAVRRPSIVSRLLSRGYQQHVHSSNWRLEKDKLEEAFVENVGNERMLWPDYRQPEDKASSYTE